MPGRDLRRGRPAAVDVIPATGATRSVGPVLPEPAGTLDGSAVRVRTEDGSLTVLTVVLERPVTAEGADAAHRDGGAGTAEGRADPAPRVLDAPPARTQEDPAEVVARHDNEWGHTARPPDLVEYVTTRPLRK